MNNLKDIVQENVMSDVSRQLVEQTRHLPVVFGAKLLVFNGVFDLVGLQIINGITDEIYAYAGEEW